MHAYLQRNLELYLTFTFVANVDQPVGLYKCLYASLSKFIIYLNYQQMPTVFFTHS
jgi:hypothetical protein